MQEKKVFWLDGFEGAAKGGAFYRSKIHLDINKFESKFKKKVVAISLEPDEGKPSLTVEFITDATDELEQMKGLSDVK